MAAKNVKQVACYLTEEQIEALNKLSAKTLAPKASLIRRAVEEFLARQSKKAKP